jgi:hypothetical protein
MRHEIPLISAEEATPLVMKLVELIQSQAKEIQQMRDEIAVLKGLKGRPKFKSSKMDEKMGKGNKSDDEDGMQAGGQEKKRPGSSKRDKTAKLVIHEEKVIAPQEPIPADARFKGYRDVVVQGIIIQAHNIRYRLACWQTSEGSFLVGQLPAELQGQHFSPTLRSYILYQHNHCHVTQPLLWEQLTEWGIDISKGQIDALLSKGKEAFHQEKDELLVTGLEVSKSVTVDDSGARHQGKNGYVLHIGNELFGWFRSTGSKSRINFLESLHASSMSYQVNEEGLSYMRLQGLSVAIYDQLRLNLSDEPKTAEEWHHHLGGLKIEGERQIQIATEGALLGGLLEKGFNPELAIVSDGAGQFAILLHALCWIHAERLIHKLIPINDQQREAIAVVRDQVWIFYADLKVYKVKPDEDQRLKLEARFDVLFTQSTGYDTLDRLLRRLHRRRDELLLVLKRPDIPLHTNGSETDIRDYVKKRKVSGGTRSDLGRQCRDTFASLKKTCRKLGVSFWQYLLDRESKTYAISPLPTLMRHAAIARASP